VVTDTYIIQIIEYFGGSRITTRPCCRHNLAVRADQIAAINQLLFGSDGAWD
jgi:hypothetical protein